jgi:hypothetical protein
MPTDYEIMHAMVKHGGKFVSMLGLAMMCADPENRQKIKKAFGEYWGEYTEIAGRKEVGQ